MSNRSKVVRIAAAVAVLAASFIWVLSFFEFGVVSPDPYQPYEIPIVAVEGIIEIAPAVGFYSHEIDDAGGNLSPRTMETGIEYFYFDDEIDAQANFFSTVRIIATGVGIFGALLFFAGYIRVLLKSRFQKKQEL